MPSTTQKARVSELTEQLHSSSPAGDRPLSVAVYLRSLSPPAGTHDGYRSCLDALAELDENGDVSALQVSVWGDRLCLCDACTATRTGRAMLDRVEQFQHWAAGDRREVTLPLERREIRTAYAGEDREVIVLPQVLAAVYSGSEPLSVFPHTADGTTYSVADGVAALARAAGTRRSVTVPPIGG